MTDEVIFQRNTIQLRRLRLAPGEAMLWHRDPFQRIAIVVSGDLLSIEYRDGGETLRVEISPGMVDWEEPSKRVHRAINIGRTEYQQVTIFFLDSPDAVPQPSE
jgi:Cupin domain.